MNTAQWTVLLWAIIILVAPLILGFILKLGQSFLLTKSKATQDWVEYWVTFFVEAAQQKEPDSGKRKAWVVANIIRMFPKLPPEQVDALVEGILNELKNQYDDWKANGAQPTPPDATPPLA